jgi:hypothetical protein
MIENNVTAQFIVVSTALRQNYRYNNIHKYIGLAKNIFTEVFDYESRDFGNSSSRSSNYISGILTAVF